MNTLSPSMAYRVFWISRSIVRQVALALMLASFAAAGRSEDAPWIELEVILFKHLDPDSAGDEQWPERPALRYPEPLIVLQDPQIRAAAMATLTDQAAERVEAEYGIAKADLLAPLPPDPDAEETSSARNDTDQTVTEQPFLLLPPDALRLQAAVQRMNTSRKYRVIQHLAWRQPKVKKGRSSRIALKGGKQWIDHNEVEGALELEQSAFLHGTAMLWLNQFSGQRLSHHTDDSPDQIVLPEQPTAPALELPDPAQLAETLLATFKTNQSILDARRARAETNAASRAAAPAFSRQAPVDLGNEPIILLESSPDEPVITVTNPAEDPEPEAVFDLNDPGLNPLADRAFLQPPLPDDFAIKVTAKPKKMTAVVSQTVLLEQSRKLGLGQVHYYDHPLFGMIVAIRPYDPAATDNATTASTVEQ